MKFSIRGKIISGFVIIFAISMIIGIYGFYSISKTSVMSNEEVKLREAEVNISNVLKEHYNWRQNLSTAIFMNTEIPNSYDLPSSVLIKWRNSEEANIDIAALLNKVDGNNSFIHQRIEIIIDMMRSGDKSLVEKAQKDFTEKILPKTDETISILNEMTDKYNTLVNDKAVAIDQYEQNTISVIVILIILGTILCICLAIAILRAIMKPIQALANFTNNVADGNFNVDFTYGASDEIGILVQNFTSLTNTFKLLTSDINKMSEQHSAGEVDYFIQTDKYKGEFQQSAYIINSMIKEYSNDTKAILNIAGKYADGDFSAKLEPLPGKKVKANIILDNVSNSLQGIEESAALLVGHVVEGELDKRIDASGFKGNWKNIIISMNRLLESVEAPIVDLQNTLALVSQGRMDVTMAGAYKGQFKKIANSINRTIIFLSMYTQDISYSFSKLSANNIDIEIAKDYVGTFSDINGSLNTIINRLNNIMEDIIVQRRNLKTEHGSSQKQAWLYINELSGDELLR